VSNRLNSHEDYKTYLGEWVFMRDALKGNTKIKREGTKYLSYPSNLPRDGGMQNYYTKFLKLTDFPELTSQAMHAMMGLALSQPSTLVADNSSLMSQGNYIHEFYEKVLREVITMGRVGVLLEIDASDIGVKEIMYKTEDIISWNVDAQGSVDFVILKQNEYKFNDETYSYEATEQTLVLRLVDGIYTQELRDKNFDLIMSETPRYKGNTFDFIPFYIITPRSLNSEVANSPLSPIAHLCLHIYRNNAIWNKLIGTKGDPFTFFSGFEDSEMEHICAGANNVVSTRKKDSSINFIEMKTGSEFIKQKIEYDTETAQAYAGKLLNVSNTLESGESILQRRLMSEIGLKSIIKAVSLQYTMVLRAHAFILGEKNIENIEYKGFAEFSAKIQDINDLMAASGLINQGVISKKSFHTRAADLGLTDVNYDVELERIHIEGAKGGKSSDVVPNVKTNINTST